MIRMIAVDLDRTFLRDDKTVSAYALNVVDKLRARGIVFVLATARPIRGVTELLPFLRYDAAIYHNGAVVMKGNKILVQSGVCGSGTILKRMLADNPNARVAAEISDKLYANFDVKVLWPRIAYTHTTSFEGLEAAVADKLLVQIDEPDSIREIEQYLSDELYVQVSEGVVAMVMNRSATKLHGIQALARAYGLPMESVAAFGDDWNDLYMLRECGVGVAMGNALAEVKAAAKEICDTNQNDGVAKWLEGRLMG